MLIYDGENRPLVIIKNGIASVMAYGPDTERTSKTTGQSTTHYLGNDSELTINQTTGPQGEFTSYLHPDVRREGLASDFMMKDHLASNRNTIRFGSTDIGKHNYSPYGTPLETNGATIDRKTTGGSKGYINERQDPGITVTGITVTVHFTGITVTVHFTAI